jgi:hypothetical protein
VITISDEDNMSLTSERVASEVVSIVSSTDSMALEDARAEVIKLRTQLLLNQEECEHNPKPRPKPKTSSADVADRGVASIGVRSSGNLCVEEESVCVYYCRT